MADLFCGGFACAGFHECSFIVRTGTRTACCLLLLPPLLCLPGFWKLEQEASTGKEIWVYFPLLCLLDFLSKLPFSSLLPSFLPPFLSVFLSFCVSPSLPPSYYACHICHICHIYFIYVCIWCGRFHVSPRPWLASWKSWTVFTAPNARDLVIGKMLATNVLPTCYPLATRRYHQWLCLLCVFAHSFWFKVWSRTCHTLGLSVIKWPALKFGERLPYFCWPQKLGRDQIAVRFRAKRMIDLSIGAWEALRSITINIACVSRIFHSKIRHVHLIQTYSNYRYLNVRIMYIK